MLENIDLVELEPLDRRVSTIMVTEGRYAVADFGDDESYISTLGLYICKGIVLYDPTERRGLLAHLNYTNDFESAMGTLVRAFGSETSNARLTVVQARQDGDEPHWPTVDSIASFFHDQGVAHAAVDLNTKKKQGRGISLSLEDGRVTEVDNQYDFTEQVLGRSQYIEN